MKSLLTGLTKFLRGEEGVTAIEYGLIAALIALAIIAAVTLVGTNLDLLFDRIAACLTTTGCPAA